MAEAAGAIANAIEVARKVFLEESVRAQADLKHTLSTSSISIKNLDANADIRHCHLCIILSALCAFRRRKDALQHRMGQEIIAIANPGGGQRLPLPDSWQDIIGSLVNTAKKVMDEYAKLAEIISDTCGPHSAAPFIITQVPQFNFLQ